MADDLTDLVNKLTARIGARLPQHVGVTAETLVYAILGTVTLELAKRDARTQRAEAALVNERKERLSGRHWPSLTARTGRHPMRDLTADLPTILTAARSDPPDTEAILKTLAEVWADGADVGCRAADYDYNTAYPPVSNPDFPQVSDLHPDTATKGTDHA